MHKKYIIIVIYYDRRGSYNRIRSIFLELSRICFDYIWVWDQ